MSPSEAPESDEPYCATASFSSAISRALIESPILRPDLSTHGHQGIDLVALAEAFGALIVAVARQIGAADEGAHAVGQLDFDAAVL